MAIGLSKKKKNKNNLEYTPFGDSVFGMEDMFAQGATALDIAAIVAIENRDVKSLIKIGAKYTAMAAAIARIDVQPEEEIRLGFGFCMEREVEDDRSECIGEDDD